LGFQDLAMFWGSISVLGWVEARLLLDLLLEMLTCFRTGCGFLFILLIIGSGTPEWRLPDGGSGQPS